MSVEFELDHLTAKLPTFLEDDGHDLKRRENIILSLLRRLFQNKQMELSDQLKSVLLKLLEKDKKHNERLISLANRYNLQVQIDHIYADNVHREQADTNALNPAPLMPVGTTIAISGFNGTETTTIVTEYGFHHETTLEDGTSLYSIVDQTHLTNALDQLNLAPEANEVILLSHDEHILQDEETLSAQPQAAVAALTPRPALGMAAKKTKVDDLKDGNQYRTTNIGGVRFAVPHYPQHHSFRTIALLPMLIAGLIPHTHRDAFYLHTMANIKHAQTCSKELGLDGNDVAFFADFMNALTTEKLARRVGL